MLIEGIVAKEQMAKPANYLGAVAYGGLCLTGIMSIGWIRKRWWLVFKFGHHVGPPHRSSLSSRLASLLC